MKNLHPIALVVAVALLAAACGDDSTVSGSLGGGGPVDDGAVDNGSVDNGSVDNGTTDGDGATTSTVRAGRGWLEDGDLDWVGTSDDGARDAASGAVALADDRGADFFDEAAPESTVIIERPDDNSPLSAGSIDDGADVSAYLEYRDLIIGSGIAVRDLDISDSTLITVIGDNGLPVLDAAVEFWDPTADTDAPMVSLRTTADGTVRFLPGAMTDDRFDRFDIEVTIGDVRETISFARGADAVTVNLPVEGGLAVPVPLDVHFVIDATGSMGDEIARLRDNMISVAEQIAALPSSPDVRFGLTAYRDIDDLFVTRTFDLTDNLDDFLDALALVSAEGGGDYPESMDEALADALDKPAWRRDGAVELMILIADAPPQVGRQVASPYTTSALVAAARGVKIFPVAASGTDDQAEFVMRELAFVSGGRFVFLSYGVDGAATGDSTDITADDYDELALDQLVVKIVEDELAALAGGGVDPQPSTTTTIDPVQTTTTVDQ